VVQLGLQEPRSQLEVHDQLSVHEQPERGVEERTLAGPQQLFDHFRLIVGFCLLHALADALDGRPGLKAQQN